MPAKRKPAYTLHKPSGQARCRISGKDHYLGLYGTPESRDKYDALVAEWFARQGDVSGYSLTVDDLAVLFLKHAETYYVKNGEPTSEVTNIRIALRPLVRLFGRTRAKDFGPLKLKSCRDSMIEAGCVRTSINRQVGRIKRVFRWAAENEMIPATVPVSLDTVAGLRKGRSQAAESQPVTLVSDAAVAAVEPFVSRQVWAMIQLQRFSGCRPGEVVVMRGCDLNMSGPVWEYVPESHKTEHHDKRRIVFLGPKAQAVVREFLKPELEAYLFSPADARREFDEKRKASRATPMTPSQRKRQRKRKPKKQPGAKYTTCSYGYAIRKACEKAFNMPGDLQPEEVSAWRRKHCWHPHQLRHSAATDIRRAADIDTARTVLGHSTVAMTEVYAERDAAAAAEIMGRIG